MNNIGCWKLGNEAVVSLYIVILQVDQNPANV